MSYRNPKEHAFVKNNKQLVVALGQEAEETLKSAAAYEFASETKDLASVLHEVLDVTGYLEVALLHLPKGEFEEFCTALSLAIAAHQIKCAARGYRPLSRLYEYLDSMVVDATAARHCAGCPGCDTN